MESESSKKPELSARFGVRHLFVFLGEFRVQSTEFRVQSTDAHLSFSRIPGVCQCVRDAGEPFRGHRLHVGGEEHGLGRVQTGIYSW